MHEALVGLVVDNFGPNAGTLKNVKVSLFFKNSLTIWKLQQQLNLLSVKKSEEFISHAMFDLQFLRNGTLYSCSNV